MLAPRKDDRRVWLGGYTVYALIDPRDGACRYIGYSKFVVKRYDDHLDTKPTTYKGCWISQLLALELEPIMRPLCVVSDVNTAKEIETALITRYRNRGYRLTNGTDGGDGTAGRTHSEQAIQKIKQARASQVVRHSAKTKQKMSDSWTKERRESNPLRGKKRPAEVCAKIAQARRGKTMSEATKSKISVARREKFASGAYDNSYTRTDKFVGKGEN